MRGQFLEQRRQLAQQWADFCEGKERSSNVVQLQKAA
jgi:hypothetical protein